MIAHVRGPVAAVTLTVGRRRRRRGGHAGHVHARHDRTLRIGQEAQLSTSMVVREDSLTSLRLREHRRARPVRAGADRKRRRAQGGPGDARGARPRSAAPRHGQGDLTTLTLVPGIGRKGAERMVGRAQGPRRGHARWRPAGTAVARPGPRGAARARLVGTRCRLRARAGRPPTSTGIRSDVDLVLRDALRTLARDRDGALIHDGEFDAIVAEAGPEDRAFEAALRPRTLDSRSVRNAYASSC